MEIQTVGIVGGGQMGSGIAQVTAMAGFPTVVVEVNEELSQKGLRGIFQRLERLVHKGIITDSDRAAIQARLQPSTETAQLANCDLVIEAITENREEKLKLWRTLDGIVKREAIFASNTSSLSITEMMMATSRAERFVGLHFFNPVPVMELVEVTRTFLTNPQVYETVLEFVEKLGKTPVRTADRAGFIVNRLLMPYLMDSIRALEEGAGSISDIDRAMKLGCGHPMGPFLLLDFIGLDTAYSIANSLFEEYRELRFAPPSLLKRLVTAGWYGRKAGKGFYDYSDPDSPQPLSHLSRLTEA
ncbi:MAG: 3-hydroxyacyl-CoA dehydrogenase family protein [Acidobacteria bacterium]|nr:3-hydroxyacyl-CoA dehydrogenase family protein [Acidobacteriota bacterium]